MEIPNYIHETYSKYAKKAGYDRKKFPYGTTPHEFGGPYLELSPDGKMAIVARDRGKETSRQETYSIDELMYWVFCDDAYSTAFDEHDVGFEEAQQIALNEIGKVSAEWRERLRKEQEEIRRKNSEDEC